MFFMSLSRIRRKPKGVITVFFALLSALFIAFFSVLTESARIRAARAHMADLAEMANFSVFGEFEKQLLEEFEVFGLNAAYGTGDFSVSRISARLRHYLNANAQVDSHGLSALCFDPWQIRIISADITDYALLSDMGGEYFYQQVVSYMHETALTQAAGQLMEYYEQAQTAQQKQEAFAQQEQSADHAMENVQKQEEALRKEREAAQAQDPFGNPAGGVVPEPEPAF